MIDIDINVFMISNSMNTKLIERICAKSKELANEKKKNFKIEKEKKDLKNQIKNLKMQHEKLKQDMKLKQIKLEKCMLEICTLKMKLFDENNYESDIESTMSIDISNSIDALYGDESLSETETPNSEDVRMIDPAYDNSDLDSDKDFNINNEMNTQETNEQSTYGNSESGEHDLSESLEL